MDILNIFYEKNGKMGMFIETLSSQHKVYKLKVQEKGNLTL